MIYYFVTATTTRDIGKYYNQCLSILPDDDDYACFIDSDAMFTTYGFEYQLDTITKRYPECGIFVATANRIGCTWQRAGEWESDDIVKHRSAGTIYKQLFELDVVDVSNKPKDHVLGGFLMLVRKSTWRNVGRFKEEGQLGVDNDLHWKAQAKNERVYLMKGVYLYHWYRGGNPHNKQHLR